MAGTSNAVRAGAAFVELFADDVKLYASLEKAKGKVTAFAQTMTRSGAAIAAAGGAVGVPLSAALAAALSDGAQVQKLARDLGTSAEEVTAFGYAANSAGVPFAKLGGFLEGLPNTISELADQTSGAAAAFRRLGIPTQDLINIPFAQQMEVFAQAVAQIEKPVDRARFATEVFGDAGRDLLPLLAKGAAGYRSLADEAKATGQVMSTDDANRAAQGARALSSAYESVRKAVVEVGLALVPSAETVGDLSARFRNGVKDVVGWVREHRQVVVAAAAVAAGVVAAGTAFAAIGSAITGFLAFKGAIVAGFLAIKAVVLGIGAVIAAVGWPVTLAVAAVAAGVYLIREIFADELPTLGEAWAVISDAAEDAWDAIKAGARYAWDAIKAVWAGVSGAAEAAWGRVKQVWAGLMRWGASAAEALSPLTKAVREAVGVVADRAREVMGWVRDVAGAVGKVLGDVAGAIGDTIGVAIADYLVPAVKWLDGVLGVSRGLDATWKAFTFTLGLAWEGVKAMIPSWGAVKSAVQDIVDLSKRMLPSWEAVKKLGRDAGRAIALGFAAVEGVILRIGKTLAEKLIQPTAKFLEALSKFTGVDIGDGMIAEIKTLSDTLKAAAARDPVQEEKAKHAEEDAPKAPPTPETPGPPAPGSRAALAAEIERLEKGVARLREIASLIPPANRTPEQDARTAATVERALSKVAELKAEIARRDAGGGGLGAAIAFGVREAVAEAAARTPPSPRPGKQSSDAARQQPGGPPLPKPNLELPSLARGTFAAPNYSQFFASPGLGLRQLREAETTNKKLDETKQAILGLKGEGLVFA